MKAIAEERHKSIFVNFVISMRLTDPKVERRCGLGLEIRLFGTCSKPTKFYAKSIIERFRKHKSANVMTINIL